jgi:hypothetical protein
MGVYGHIDLSPPMDSWLCKQSFFEERGSFVTLLLVLLLPSHKHVSSSSKFIVFELSTSLSPCPRIRGSGESRNTHQSRVTELEIARVRIYNTDSYME